MVIFGVTGDLARKKLMPAIYDLANRGLLPPTLRAGRLRPPRLGPTRTSPRSSTTPSRSTAARRSGRRSGTGWPRDSGSCQGAFDDDDAFDRLAETLDKLDAERGTGGNHAFYLSIPPKSFPVVCEQLHKSGLAAPAGRPVEPGGHREAVRPRPGQRARRSTASVNAVFPEESVFRIDHYLGKETVQNILALRFANQLFEPIWNAHYVDHVQITMAEDIGLGGRAGYYDGIGAARDVIQNHLMQLLALTAMEEPVSFSPHELQAEKIKVLSATQLAEPLDETTSRGQYAAGWQGGEKVVGLLDEEGFAKDSTTETFAAITLEVDTRRWAGVPFYLRTGKRLGRRVTEIALVFKRAPHLPFDATMTDELGKNALVIRVQPDEGVTLRFGSKVPGSAMEVRDVNMDFSYGSAFAEDSPEAYERLILDVLLGEPSLFPVNEEVELAWEILDPVARVLGRRTASPTRTSRARWGPESAFEMLRRTGREWRRPDDRRSAGHHHHGGQQEARRTARKGRRRHDGPGADAGHRAGQRGDPRRVDRGRQRRQPRAPQPGHRGDAGQSDAAEPRLDAQLRVGGDAGASEVVVLRLSGPLAGHAASVVMPFLLPDIPVVAWWPDVAPAVPAQDPLGQLAIRRITDATNGVDPLAAIKSRLPGYTAGDTDLAWARITYWRALLTSAVDQTPHEPIESALVSGSEDRARPGRPGGLAGQPDRRPGAPGGRRAEGRAGSARARPSS